MTTIKFTGSVNDASRVEEWSKQLWVTHQRDQFWSGTGLVGEGPNNVIMRKTGFAEKAGYQMTEDLVMPITGAGVSGDSQLEDQEEAPDFYAMTWTIAQLRNAIRVEGKETEQATHHDLPMVARELLGNWMAETKDEDIFTAIASSCSKIIYVNGRAGTSTVVATDLMTLATLSQAKTYAKSTADPKIKPIKISGKGGKASYRYVVVMHDHVSYDLVINDPVYQQITRDAGSRGNSNQLFSGALIDWQDMVLYDHDNCTIATAWGSGSTVYGAESYLLGRQACVLGIGGYRIQGKKGFLKWIEKKFDLTDNCADDYTETVRIAA